MHFPAHLPALCRLALLASAIVVVAPVAQAEPLPGGAALGMTVPQLQQAEPALKRVPHPARMTGGLVGTWSGRRVQVGGVALTPTFFLADGQLLRIEYLASEAGPGAFAALQAWASSAWGEPLVANAPEGTYASWDSGDMQVYLQSTRTSRGEQLRLVAKRRVLKDGSEL